MTFLTCSCHVWAIDGYTDDERAAELNRLYNEKANIYRQAATSGSRTKSLKNDGERNARVRDLVQAIQRDLGSELVRNQNVIIYGGFRATQQAPEHMWIEYNNKIYDTMPGHPLCC